MSVLDLAGARRGHFRMESGYHSALWLDLDDLFSDGQRIEPEITALATKIGPYDVEAVCGPQSGGAVLAQRLAEALAVDGVSTERVDSRNEEGLFKARYRLPPEAAGAVRHRRVAIVDDVMSAGSSLRSTCTDLESHSARIVVVGALLVLGTAGLDYFTQLGLTVEANTRAPYEIWPPERCPLCAAGVPVSAVGDQVKR